MKLYKRTQTKVAPIPCRSCGTLIERDRETRVFCGERCKDAYYRSPMFYVPEQGWVGGYWPVTWEAQWSCIP